MVRSRFGLLGRWKENEQQRAQRQLRRRVHCCVAAGLQRRAGVTDRASSLREGITTTLEGLAEAAVLVERQAAAAVR